MRRVFVVDDSKLARKMLIKSLPSGWEAEITQFGSGDEALTACRAGAPDVLFLDLNMPEVDGYNVLEGLGPAMPASVIVVSADVQSAAQERVFSLGAKAFVKKPAKPAEIEAALKAAGAL